MSEPPPTYPQGLVKYDRVFIRTLLSFKKHLPQILPRIAIYLILFFFLVYIDYYKPVRSQTLLQIAYSFVQSLIAINIHRVVILGSQSVSPLGVRFWDFREVTFILNALGLLIIIHVIATILSLGLMGSMTFTTLFISLSIIALIISIICSRFCLVFPAIAIDKTITFRKSWAVTKNYKWLIFLSVIITPFLFFLPFLFASFFIEFFLYIGITFALIGGIMSLSHAYELINEETGFNDDSPNSSPSA